MCLKNIKNMSNLLFTTSWDDGSVLDLKLEELLSRYGIKGTFYVPKQFDGEGLGRKFSSYGRRLNESEIIELSSRQEIGGHSLTHRNMAGLTQEEIKEEIFGSKVFLENLIGNPLKIFSFPGGKFNEDVLRYSKEAGFLGVRTTKKLTFHKPTNSFLMDVTTVCQPFPFRKLDSNHFYWKDILSPLSTYQPMQFSTSWLSLAKKLFNKALLQGNYFHLYGHSWELEKYDMWEDLESFLKFVKTHKDVSFLTNGEFFKIP